MDDLRALQSETSHSAIMDKMRLIDVSELFPEYNTKVLVASFMLYKFNSLHNIDEELYEISKKISDAMVNLDFKQISELYPRYFDKFMQWRDDDIQTMKQDIQNQIQACEDTATSPRDEADETWNRCVSESIDIMNKKIDQLDVMSRTPPRM